MKSAAPSTPRNNNSNHPPLAYDSQGHPIAMPDGSMFWLLKRQTSGRPKVILGPDRRPARLPLDTTAEEIAETYGAGTYRLDALDVHGNAIDHVTTLTIGDDANDEDEAEDARSSPGRRSGTSDLRFALETITQMAQAASKSLQAVAESQADWVKGLAAARLIPRNALYTPAGTPLQLPVPAAEIEDDEDEVETDEAEEVADAAPYAAIAQAANGIVQGIPAVMQSINQTVSTVAALRNATKSAPTGPSATSSSGPNPMVHLSEINDRLSGPERRFLRHILGSEHADAVTHELLTRSVDDAVALVRQSIATVQAERAGAASPGQGAAAAESHRPAGADDGAFMAHVTAVATLLSPEECADAMAVLPRLPPPKLEMLKQALLAMSVDDAASWIRENLPSLKAEAAAA